LSPWYCGLFYDTTDNQYLTDEFVKKFVEINDLNFLTDDSQMEVYEKIGNDVYCQKAFVSGWIPIEICEKFVNAMNAQLNITAFYSNLPKESNLREFQLSVGLTFTSKVDAKENLLLDTVKMESNYRLLRENHLDIYTWGNDEIIEKIFGKLRRIIVINTNYKDTRGALLDRIIHTLESIKYL
jgi:hypothetical protein